MSRNALQIWTINLSATNILQNVKSNVKSKRVGLDKFNWIKGDNLNLQQYFKGDNLSINHNLIGAIYECKWINI